MKPVLLVLALAACGGAQQPHRGPNEGTIAGVARDHDSGEPVAHATIVLRGEDLLTKTRTVTSDGKGAYSLDHIPAGRYSLSASFGGQPINVDHIVVERGKSAVVDLTFTLGKPDAITVDFGNPKEGAIERYHPPHQSPAVGVIEGTVIDIGTHERVAGAVVTAAIGPNAEARMAIADDQGRYRFEDVQPATYTVSAYYSVGGRGQIEIRRSDIAVAGGEGVIVPLWIESARQ